MTQADQSEFDHSLCLDPVAASWAREAEARVDAFDRGDLTADSADAVFERLAKR